MDAPLSAFDYGLAPHFGYLCGLFNSLIPGRSPRPTRSYFTVVHMDAFDVVMEPPFLVINRPCLLHAQAFFRFWCMLSHCLRILAFCGSIDGYGLQLFGYCVLDACLTWLIY